MTNRSFLFIFVLALFLSACGMKSIATNVIGKVATDGMVVVEGEEDIDFSRESAPALIKTIEVLHQGNPKDRRTLVVLSESYGQYAFGFVEEDILKSLGNDAELAKLRTKASAFYRKGREYGIGALINKGSMHKAFKSSFAEFKKAVGGLGEKYVSALFWTSFNWANFINLHLDDPQVIVDLPRIEAMIDRVLEVEPNFYFGSAHSLKAVISATRPKMLGGNPDQSKREFEEAIKVAPDYLMTKVLYAQYYARQTQDVNLFKKLLNEVIEADAAKLPAARLANELAKRRATLLLNNQKKLF